MKRFREATPKEWGRFTEPQVSALIPTWLWVSHWIFLWSFSSINASVLAALRVTMPRPDQLCLWKRGAEEKITEFVVIPSCPVYVLGRVEKMALALCW